MTTSELLMRPKAPFSTHFRHFNTKERRTGIQPRRTHTHNIHHTQHNNSLESTAQLLANLAEDDLVQQVVFPGQKGTHRAAKLKIGIAFTAHAQRVVHQLLAEGGLLGDALHNAVVNLGGQ